MSKKINNVNKDSFNDVKVSKEEVAEYAKKLGVFSKKKVVAGIAAATVLVLGGAGAGTYYGIKAMNNTGSGDSSGFKDGEIELVPGSNASLSEFKKDESGNKVGTVTAKDEKTIEDVTVSIGKTKLVKGTDFSVTDPVSNADKSSKIVTIFKSALEKYKGAILINPVFQGEPVTEIYVVTFNTNGGEQIIESQKIAKGKQATVPAVPTKGGCTFEYWCEDEALEKKFDFTTSITKDITLYAKWKVDEETEGLTYSDGAIEGELVVSFSGDKSKLKAVNIPATHEGKTVTSIASGAFSNCTNLEQVEIPDSITLINSSAFENCLSLTTINIPTSVKTIGTSCFKYCVSLKNITLPEGLTTISASMFHYCTRLETINIPSTVKTIAPLAFANSNIKSITIPESVTSLGEYDYSAQCSGRCFMNCSNLSEVNFKASVLYIRSQMFEGCTSLSSFTLPENVTSIESYAFKGTKIKGSSFAVEDKYSGWKYSVDGYSGWVLCEASEVGDKLAEGYSVQKGEFKVEGHDLFKFTYLGNLEVSVTEDTGVDPSVTTVTIPTSITRGGAELKVTNIASSGLARMCHFVDEIVVPATIKEIGSWTFYKAWSDLPEGKEEPCIKTIKFEVKEDGTSDLTKINDYAFASSSLEAVYTTSKEEADLPKGVKTLGAGAFYQLPKLTKVKLPSTLDTLAYGVSDYGGSIQYYQPSSSFVDTTALKEVFVDENNEKFASDANGLLYLRGDSNPNHTLIYFPIGKDDGSGNPLKDVVIPEGVVSIEKAAIIARSNYETMTLPSTLTNLEPRFIFEDNDYSGRYCFSSINKINLNSETIAQYTLDDWSNKRLGDGYFISRVDEFILPKSITPSGESYIGSYFAKLSQTENDLYYKNTQNCEGDILNGFYKYNLSYKEQRTYKLVMAIQDYEFTVTNYINNMYFTNSEQSARAPVIKSNNFTIYYNGAALTLNADYTYDSDNYEITFLEQGRHSTGTYILEFTLGEGEEYTDVIFRAPKGN